MTAVRPSSPAAASSANRLTATWEKVRRYRSRHGFWSTASFLSRRVYRRWDCLVYDACLNEPRPSPQWRAGERLQVVSAENVDSALNTSLVSFLGGDDAKENVDSVRLGDRLFVVSDETGYLHCGYIFFRTRQSRIIGEATQVPIIGCCKTVPRAQGRGLYQRALSAELLYLKDHGYQRAVIETHPKNIPSRKGIEAAGFRLCREARSWIVCNKLVLQRSAESSRAHWQLFLI